MRDELFNELLESVQQAGAIRRGEKAPSRSFTFDDPDVTAIREGFNLSQEKFAALMGISVGTLRNWEQGRRKPEGPARMLLKVAATHPEAVLETAMPQGEQIQTTVGGRGAGARGSAGRQSGFTSYQGGSMAGKRNEQTSSKVAKTAAKVLNAGKATPKQAKTLAASALTQAKDKAKAKGKKK
jgi:putative transcriptional regulator